jgi:hypothetical protein
MQTPNAYKFVKNKTYYTGEVYEWNLPTGTTCPFALECKVTVDRITGKFDVKRGAYRCYAASAERFPAVRNHRWNNFEYMKNGGVPELPRDCKAVRVHAAGDFFNQDYFDAWLDIAKKNNGIEFWAYTKSLRYWVSRLDNIPSKFILTASYGGREDYLIERHRLKNVKVYPSANAVQEGRPIDTNDDYARMPNINFALLDNMKVSKKSLIQIDLTHRS